jgi:hypothetical protein
MRSNENFLSCIRVISAHITPMLSVCNIGSLFYYNSLCVLSLFSMITLVSIKSQSIDM